MSESTDSPAGGKRQGRNPLVNPKRQLYLAAVVFVMGLGMSAILVWFIGDQIQMLQASLIADEGDPLATEALLSETQLSLFLKIVFICISSFAITGYVVAHLSNQMLGPEVPLLRHVKALRDGDFSHRIKLRKHDAFAGLAAELNLLAEELEAKKK